MTAVSVVSREEAKKYGIFDLSCVTDKYITAKGIIEKPQDVTSDENYAVVGRYILRSAIMNELEFTKPGAGGEIQLSDAISAMTALGVKLYGHSFSGKKIDCGNQKGWLLGILNVAARDPELKSLIENFMREL